MDQKITTAFVAPTIAYWKSELGMSLKLASSTTRPASFRNGDVVVTALVNGDMNGEVHYVVDEDTMMAFYSALVGEWPKELDDSVTDKFLEVARKFARATTRRLEKQDLEVKIRVVGTIMSVGELMGPAADIGQLEHMFAKRSGTSDEDHIRIWLKFDGAGAAEDEVEEADEAENITELEFPAPATQLESPIGRVIDIETELEDPVPEPVIEVEPAEQSGPAEVIQAKRFELVDERGEVRAVLGAIANGSPHLVLHDANGRMRAAVALSKSGAPRLMLFDAIGERIFEEPPMLVQKPSQNSQKKAA